MNPEDDVHMDYEPQDNPGISLVEQFPGEFDEGDQAEIDNAAQIEADEIAAYYGYWEGES